MELHFSPLQLLSVISQHVVRCAGIQRAVLEMPRLLAQTSEALMPILQRKIDNEEIGFIIGMVGTTVEGLGNILDELFQIEAITSLNECNGVLYPNVFTEKGIVLNIPEHFQDDNDESQNFTDLIALKQNVLNSFIYDAQL